MNYLPATQAKTARHIALTAQRKIKNTTGMQVTLLLSPDENIFRTPEKMLEVIAIALEMSPASYRMKTRKRDVVELRFIAAILLRRNFPSITLTRIADLFGGQDHSSVISGLTRANELVHTGDMKFIAKYNVAIKAVNLWLKKMNSIAA